MDSLEKKALLLPRASVRATALKPVALGFYALFRPNAGKNEPRRMTPCRP